MKRLFAGIASVCVAFSAAHAQSNDFEVWLKSFRAEASAAGVSEAVLDEAFANVSINERVFELNDNQPEFSRAIWDYLDSAVSDRKIADGRAALAEHRIALSVIDGTYGVDAETIVAIWGLESAYGRILGDYDAIQALATLGFEGRRTAYGRSQLIGALKIIQNGYADRSELKGSWAGAMGHTQFIPTTYLAYAIDHDGDGRRNIWSDLGDVFASTANYLSISKYKADQGWGVEVRLPTAFDYSLAGVSIKKPMVEWTALGVEGVRGDLLATHDPNLPARLIVPAGARGPAFLVFENFEAILKYNRSTAYALAVSMLSDEIAGRTGRAATLWPREDRPLSLDERKALQRILAERGYNPGPVDGIIGAGTKAALRKWQKNTGKPADGYASAAVLEALRQ